MEAAGQAFRVEGSSRDIRGCFRCHSTGPVTVSSRREIGITEAGVRCEVCHGPGRAHVEAAGRGNSQQTRLAIRHPRSMSADAQLRFCGSCHRSPDGGEAANDFTNAWNVRHQPPYLEQSKCFRASAGMLTCFTCHAPHDSLRRADPQHYRAKCATCHNADRRPPAAVCRSDSSSDCTTCHMPSVQPDRRLSFRNHWIGVYRSGASLIPAR
ncbi:MAG: multiheme c-type cytochrome [Bryobacteraceae bacterium]